MQTRVGKPKINGVDASSLEFLAIYQTITFGNERVETDDCEALQSTARHNRPVTQNESQIKLVQFTLTLLMTHFTVCLENNQDVFFKHIVVI